MLHIMAVVRLLMEASKGNWNPNLLGGGGQGSSKIPNLRSQERLREIVTGRVR